MAKAKLTADQLNSFLSSSKLVDLETPLSAIVDSAKGLNADPALAVHILIIDSYAVITRLEEGESLT